MLKIYPAYCAMQQYSSYYVHIMLLNCDLLSENYPYGLFTTLSMHGWCVFSHFWVCSLILDHSSTRSDVKTSVTNSSRPELFVAEVLEGLCLKMLFAEFAWHKEFIVPLPYITSKLTEM